MSDGYHITGSNGPTIYYIPSTTITGGPGQVVVSTPGGGSQYGWYYPIAVPETPTEPTQEKSKGCHCKKCKDFNEYAEPNCDDGTFICFACRKGLK
jgi:hypothetical protein